MITGLKRTLSAIVFVGLAITAMPTFTKNNTTPAKKTISQKIKRALKKFDRAFFENEAGLSCTFLPLSAMLTALGASGTVFSIAASAKCLSSMDKYGPIASIAGAVACSGMACIYAFTSRLLFEATINCAKSIPPAFQEAERYIQDLEKEKK